MVETEKANGNPIAGLIKALKLDSNTIVLSLTDPFDDVEDDFFSDDADGDEDRVTKQHERGPTQHVAGDVNLALSAYANLRDIYDPTKKNQHTTQKTKQASEKDPQHV